VSARGPVSYVTDLEGQWDRFVGSVERDDLLSLEGSRLVLADGATFVFGGDAVDRGPSSRRLLRTFLDAKSRYGDRVVLLAGNRDLNKLRLASELRGHPPPSTPPEALGDRVATLQHIFRKTMGAPDAFAHRAAELRIERGEASDTDVVESFLEDVEPDGLHSRFLAACQLGYRHGTTLFVHGGLGLESFGHVPGSDVEYERVDDFVPALNRFLAARIDAFRTHRAEWTDPTSFASWSDLVEYQAPAPGRRENPRSVVYGRLSDSDNNPSLPDPSIVRSLTRDGIHRLVVGHSPSGDLPAFVRSDDFELIVADNSRSRVTSGSSVTIDGDRVRGRGATRLDDGSLLEVEATTTLGVASAIGRREVGTGRLVKAEFDDESTITYRGLPGFDLEQLRIDRSTLAELETPWPRRD